MNRFVYGGTARMTGMVEVLLLAISLTATTSWADDPPWIARGRQGMVATESEHASQAGLETLRSGGNAVDAAVAASFVLTVTRPWHTGVGGGGFMIARMTDGRVVVQDFRGTAPAAVAQVILSVLDEELPLDQAMSRPHVNHQWQPNEVFFDQVPPPAELADPLKKRGHRVSDKERRAVVQPILRSEDGWVGACDPRGGGKPAGY